MNKGKPIKATFFEATNSFSGHSNQPFEFKDFDNADEMIAYAKSLKRKVYVRFEYWDNSPTSVYQEMFI